MSAAAKIIAVVAALIAIAILPLPWILLPVVPFVVVAWTAGLSWRRIVRRMLPIAAIAAVMCLGGLWSLGAGVDRRPMEAAVRALAAGLVLVCFGEWASFSDALQGMRRLHVPALLVSSLTLMLRSIDVLAEERRALLRGRAARNVGSPSLLAEWKGRASIVGLLLVRSVDRSERIYRAMKARGWSSGRES